MKPLGAIPTVLPRLIVYAAPMLGPLSANATEEQATAPAAQEESPPKPETTTTTSSESASSISQGTTRRLRKPAIPQRVAPNSILSPFRSTTCRSKVAGLRRISYKWNCPGFPQGEPWLMALPVRPRRFFPITPAGGVRPAHLFSGWWWSRSLCALAGSSSPIPTSSRLLTTTSVLAGKWDASGAHWRKARVSAIHSARPRDRRRGSRRFIHFLIAGVFKLFGIYTPRLGAGAAGHQQFFFRADLHSYFPDRQTMFQRKTGGLDGLAVGRVAACYVLVHALGLGDKSGGVAARTHFLADSRPRRARRADTLARVRTAVGSRRR